MTKEQGLLSNLNKSTENLSKIEDKDKWLDEVRGNEGLIERFNSEIINISSQLKDVSVRDGGINPLSKRIATQCAQIAKQYSDSKLSEVEKWIDEQFKHADSLDKQDDTVTRYFSGKKDGLSLIKIKIQSLKQ